MSHVGDANDGVASTLPAGTTLNEYRIGSVLGQGGFGITYLASDTHLDEEVAIKEYFPRDGAVRAGDLSARPRLSGSDDAYHTGLAAFIDEARIIARLRHPNIVQVRRFFEARGTAYIVLDYVAGRSLEDVMADAPLPEDVILSIMAGILRGLETVHGRAILHRDLKPRNVIIRDDGTPVLLDFGAARDFRVRNQHTVTHIASSGYSPPEQYGVGSQHGPWSDLYALGAMAYRGVTGRVPPDSLRRLREDPLAPAAQMAGYSAALLRMIDRMVAVDPEDRPASVAEVRIGLPSLGTAATVPLGRKADRKSTRAAPAQWTLTPSRPSHRRSGWRGPALAAGLSLISIIGGAAALRWSDRHTSGGGSDAPLARSSGEAGDASTGSIPHGARASPPGVPRPRASSEMSSVSPGSPTRHDETAEAAVPPRKFVIEPLGDGTARPHDETPAAKAGTSTDEQRPEGPSTEPRPEMGPNPDDGAARQASPFRRSAPAKRFVAQSGETIRVQHYYALASDCAPVGWPRIQIRLRPIAGQVTSYHGTGRPHYPDQNPRHACNYKDQPAEIVTYRAPQGFKGFDHFTLDVVFPDDRTFVQSFVVDVR